jgi:site-specific DNA-adenine methylase
MNRDALRIIERFSHAECLVYLDPPYTQCSTNFRYKYDVSQDRLVELMQSSKSMIILSGYPNELYSPLEKDGWLRVDKVIDSLASKNPTGEKSEYIKTIPDNGVYDFHRRRSFPSRAISYSL